MDYTKKGHKLIGFILPAMLVYGLFCLYPIIMAFIYSFFDWNGGNVTMKFTYFENYEIMLADKNFFTALKNSFTLAGYGIFIKLPLAMFLAVILNYKLVKAKRLFRLTFFLPCIISAAAVALMWKLIYEPNFGLLNELLSRIGLESLTKNWLADTDTVIYFALIPSIWASVGFNFVLFSAGITSINKDVLESAEIDGATFVKRFFYIILPLLKDIIVVSMILDLVGSLRSFDLIFILTQGGPSNASHLLATYMYKNAFQLLKFGYGSAISVIICVLSLAYRAFIDKLFYRQDNLEHKGKVKHV